MLKEQSQSCQLDQRRAVLVQINQDVLSHWKASCSWVSLYPGYTPWPAVQHFKNCCPSVTIPRGRRWKPLVRGNSCPRSSRRSLLSDPSTNRFDHELKLLHLTKWLCTNWNTVGTVPDRCCQMEKGLSEKCRTGSNRNPVAPTVHDGPRCLVPMSQLRYSVTNKHKGQRRALHAMSGGSRMTVSADKPWNHWRVAGPVHFPVRQHACRQTGQTQFYA